MSLRRVVPANLSQRVDRMAWSCYCGLHGVSCCLVSGATLTARRVIGHLIHSLGPVVVQMDYGLSRVLG